MSDASEVFVVTIDGPSGVGKGTVSRWLAKKLGFHLLESGVLYRLVAVIAENNSLGTGDTESLAHMAAHMETRFVVNDAADGREVFLAGENVTARLHCEQIGEMASQFAQQTLIRKALLTRQRAFCCKPGLVADGRDMGTVVFPEAQRKFFLTASLQERAQRRFRQLKDKGENVTLAQILKDIARRDERDQNRAVAPLRASVDAQVIDTSALSAVQVYEKMLLSLSSQVPF